VNVETIIYGAIVGALIWLVAWRLGVRPRPWREALASVLLYIAFSLGLKASGLFSTDSITIAFIASMLLVAGWKRFAHMPA
jgi:4-amino-4-deoxy-L-arabinose transferase-like glycosyltransferase